MELINKLKDILHNKFDERLHPSIVFLVSSFIAQYIYLIVYYPFDLIKWRLQTKNKKYKYKSLYHAFSTEIKTNGVFSLYKGALSYMATSLLGTWIQFTIYETVIKYFKEKNHQLYQNKEPIYVVYASIIAGMASSLVCNAPEALVALKQAEPEHKLENFIRREKYRLLTKGLGINMYYQSIHSAMFFLTVTYVGKIFNVKLED